MERVCGEVCGGDVARGCIERAWGAQWFRSVNGGRFECVVVRVDVILTVEVLMLSSNEEKS